MNPFRFLNPAGQLRLRELERLGNHVRGRANLSMPDGEYWSFGGGMVVAPPEAAEALTLTCTVNTFTESGTWTKPDGLLFAIVEVVDAGGGGGGVAWNDGTYYKIGGGGGAGSYGRILLQASALGATETVAVGVGGAKGTNHATTPTDGSPGSGSYFGAHMVTDFGRGGHAMSDQTTPNKSALPGAGGTGGIAGANYITASGGDGQYGLRVADLIVLDGRGGDSHFGPARGFNGQGSPGCGGLGGIGDLGPGATDPEDGEDGLVIVYEYTAT